MRLTNDMRSEFVDAVMADVPKEDFEEQARKLAVQFACKRLPDEVFMIWLNEKTREYVATHQMYHRIGGHSTWWVLPGKQAFEFTPEEEKELVVLLNKDEAQNVAHNEMRVNLKALAKSVTTTKRLRELVPEMDKYIPADEGPKSYPVAVTGIVASLTKLGWPK